jgi:hypothetical protein
MSDWKVSSGRIVLFMAAPAMPVALSSLDLYKHVWGADPESFQKSQNPLMPSVAQGRRGSLAVASAVLQSRIDFIFSPLPPSQMGSSKFHQIGDARLLRSELQKVVEVIRHGLPNGAEVLRVAFTLQLQSSEPNLIEANKTVVATLPDDYRVKIMDEEDFILQINHPYISSTVANEKVNFVKRWSVDRFRVLNFQFVGSAHTGAHAAAENTDLQDFTAAGMVLDINSLFTGSPISSENQFELLGEALSIVGRVLKADPIAIKGFLYG